MAENNLNSLDEWKEFFHRVNADIFKAIEGAILVARDECPNELVTRRHEIIDTLYLGKKSSYQRIQTPKGIAEDRESNNIRIREDTGHNKKMIDEVAETSESKTGTKLENLNSESKLLEEESKIVGEVMRIKGVLTNWKKKSEKDLYTSLRQLKVLKLSPSSFRVRIDKATEVGKIVTRLQKHSSEKIRKLARQLMK